MSARRKKGGFLTFLLAVLTCVCVAGIGYSGYRIYAIRAEYAKGERLYDDIRRKAEGGATLPAGETAGADATAQPGGGTTGSIDGGVARTGSEIDFDALGEVNGDTVAWIAIPDTKIDYPVVQGEDNVFYLDHMFTGEHGSVGSIFMEKTNAPDFSDRNTILFGHHMKDGSMFAGLDQYDDQAYYEAHPTMTLYTPEGDRAVEIFAGYAIAAAPLPTSFETEDAFLKYVSDARARSNFKSDVPVEPGDRILTLCTCSYVTDDARYILIGVIR